MAIGATVVMIIPPSMVAATLMVLSPLTHVTKKVDGTEAVGAEKVKVMPGAAGIPCVAANDGKAITGRAALVDGQDTMNEAAKVYTGLRPRAVPYGLAGATSPRLKRCSDVWRASVTRMDPATPRYVLLLIKPAPPR